MSEYTAMQQELREGAVLRKAVMDYLDDFYEADEEGARIPWPQTLEELTGWTPHD